MLIYHGSSHIIMPEFGQGKKYNDYGRGFYCTEIADMAREWAVDESRNGYLNQYFFDESGLICLNLNDEKYNILQWLEILISNRRFTVSSALAKEACEYLHSFFHVDMSNVDYIIGYRADDSYFSFSQDFLNGTISVRQLNEAMMLGRLGEQIVLKSERAFEAVKFIFAEPVLASEWYVKKQKRDHQARRDYFSMDKSHWVRGDVYITTILDQEMGADDVRLR